MKLELNIKEWIAMFGLLERNSTTPDKYLTEIHLRMKSTLVSIMTEAERDQFEKWSEVTAAKVKDLEQQNERIRTQVRKPEVLTDDDGEFPVQATPDASLSK